MLQQWIKWQRLNNDAASVSLPYSWRLPYSVGMNDAMMLWLLMTALLTLPAGCALALRSVRCPGWPVVGGIVAGILLGPSLFGRIAPNSYEQWFIGGVEQREQRDALRSRHVAEQLIAEQRMFDAAEQFTLRERQNLELQQAQQLLDEARWQHQMPLRSFALLMIALVLVGTGLLSLPANRQQQSLLGAICIGAWAALLPGSLAFLALTRWWGFPPAEAALTAAAVAIGPWVLPSTDKAAADQAEFGGAWLIQNAGRIASLLALGAALWGMYQQRGSAGLMLAAPLLALPVGWLLNFSHLPKRAAMESIVNSVLLPSLAALAIVRIELFHAASWAAFWLIIVFLLLSGDARWLGAFCGAMLPGGRSSLRTMRLVMGSMAAGPTQLAVTAHIAHTMSVRDELVLALVLGAALIELTTPMRRSLAQQLADTEQELDQLNRLD